MKRFTMVDFLVIVDCSNNYLSVCYIPHHHSPYHNLIQKLKQNNSIAGINIRQINTRHHERCKLIFQRNREFCIQIFESELFSECLIYKTYFQSKKIMYKANLQIIYDASSTSSKDMQFPIKCITDDVSLSNSQRFTTPSKPTLSFVKINLDFINDNEEVVQSVSQNEPIKLQIQLISNHQYFSRTESCYLSNNSASGIGKQSFESVKIITNGCPESLHGFYARFQNVILNKNKVISEGFFAFSRYQVDSIMIKCTIKVCLEQIDCQPVICFENSNKINDKSPLISTNQWIYVERWAKLFLHKNNSNKNNNQIQVLTCNHLICLSMNQTMLLALLLSGLVIALISLLIIYGSSKNQNIKVKKKELFNIQKQTLSFPTSQSGCTSCSGSSQIRSYVTFKTMDRNSCTPIKCYPLVDFSRQNVPQNIPSEFDRLSNNINIESINEIYEC